MASTGRYSNDTIKLYRKLNVALYFCGLNDFWIEKVELPDKFKKIYNPLSIFIEIVMFSFMASEAVSFLTQHNLSPKQVADQMVFGISHPVLYIYVVTLIHHKERARAVLQKLAVALKRVHNDDGIEREMIGKVKFYLKAYVTSCGLCIVFYGASALLQYLTEGKPFTTVITAWPDVDDRSKAAHVARVIIYILWWVYFSRVSGSYVLILSMFIGLSSQYRNLGTYFNEMQRLFAEPGTMQRERTQSQRERTQSQRQRTQSQRERTQSQRERTQSQRERTQSQRERTQSQRERTQSQREEAHEAALKIGIKLHADTLWCVKECQKIYSIIFSAQLIMTIAELVSVMSQMMTSERNFVTMAAVVSTTSGTLISTGFLMWNAGDVTVEASCLSEAMYACGWHACSGTSSACTRKLLALAMIQAQKPVVFLALGCVEISYETYLSIVKSSYSVFSMMY